MELLLAILGEILFSIYDFSIRNVKKWTGKYEFSVSTYCCKNKARAYKCSYSFLCTTALTSLNLLLL